MPVYTRVLRKRASYLRTVHTISNDKYIIVYLISFPFVCLLSICVCLKTLKLIQYSVQKKGIFNCPFLLLSVGIHSFNKLYIHRKLLGTWKRHCSEGFTPRIARVFLNFKVQHAIFTVTHCVTYNVRFKIAT